MKIKLRLVEGKRNDTVFLVQVKKWFGWRYKRNLPQHPDQSFGSITEYESAQECIDRVILDTKRRKDTLTLIQYPSLKIL